MEKRFLPFIIRRQLSKSSTNHINKLIEQIQRFVHEEIVPKASQFDVSGKFPWDIVKEVHKLGFLNVDVPRELGGQGLDLKTKTKIYQELAYGCSVIASSLMISELAQIPLLQSGSDHLKQKYVKKMIKEPILAAYATTEDNAGSDLASAELSAVQDGDFYILNGTKTWVSNCGLASWYFVLARSSKDTSTSRLFTAFIVDRDAEGVSFSEKEPTLGQRCGDIRSLTLKNVRVSKEQIVGELGHGFKVAMQAFDRVRPLVASLGCGIQQRSLDEASKYALKKHTFGESIIKHQGVGFKLADMAQRLEASKLLVEKAAEMVDNNDPSASYYSSIAKAFSTDSAFKSASQAIQIFGANGFSSKYPVEKLLRDSNALQFMSGTNDIQRLIISRHLAKKYPSL